MLNVKANFFLLMAICGMIACNAQQEHARPKNLNEAISYLKVNNSKAELDDFKKTDETEAALRLHFTKGMWIRNKWLWGNRNPPLILYFKSMGIGRPDDISSIILTSLHRDLNGKKIDLESQVKEYLDYTKTISDCETRLSNIALSAFEKFKIGDTISVYMPVPDYIEGRNAVYYMCPKEDWSFNPKQDLKIKGILVKKYNINSVKNVFFKIKITSLNRTDTPILMEKVNVGDKHDFSLQGLRVESH